MNMDVVVKREVQVPQVRRITWIGLGINLFLSIIKFIVGIIGRSQAVVADAIHSLSDMITDISILLGVRYWSAPPDEKHPYGHHRIEAIVTAFIGFVLAFVALGIGYKAIVSLASRHTSPPGLIAIAGSVFSVVLKEIVFRWTMQVAKRTKSSALIANAWHHRSDAISSIPPIIAVGLANLDPALSYLDHIGAVIVALFVLKVAYEIIKPSLDELADHGAGEAEKEKIAAIAGNIEGVEEVHAIRTRKTGPGFHVDLHVLVDPGMTVRDGHHIAEEVRRSLIQEGPEVFDVVVHIEPFE